MCVTDAGHYYNRIWVITTGCLIWGVMTAAFSRCTSVSQGYIFWGANFHFAVHSLLGVLSPTKK